MAHVKNLQSTVQEQQKVIDFLQSQFKEKTGQYADVPQTWQKFLNVEDNKVPILDDEELNHYAIEKQDKEYNFLQALLSLDLPSKKP